MAVPVLNRKYSTQSNFRNGWILFGLTSPTCLPIPSCTSFKSIPQTTMLSIFKSSIKLLERFLNVWKHTAAASAVQSSHQNRVGTFDMEFFDWRALAQNRVIITTIGSISIARCILCSSFCLVSIMICLVCSAQDMRKPRTTIGCDNQAR